MVVLDWPAGFSCAQESVGCGVAPDLRHTEASRLPRSLQPSPGRAGVVDNEDQCAGTKRDTFAITAVCFFDLSLQSCDCCMNVASRDLLV